tara:strand:- start:414 stop:545 length:132 start_codon:yes stop_codon:yes gene_type:complete
MNMVEVVAVVELLVVGVVQEQHNMDLTAHQVLVEQVEQERPQL